MTHDRSIGTPIFNALSQLNARVDAQKGIWGTYGTKTLSLPIAMAEHGCQIIDAYQKLKMAAKH